MSAICKPIYEFLLWDNCNNNCKFCFQRENPRIFNHNQREIILNEVLSFINSDKFVKGSHILIVGGEIFDKPSDFEILDLFFNKIIDLMLNNIIDLLYINTNLIYKDLTGVWNLLKLINKNNLFNRLKFTTSYDIEGRFKSEEDRNLMLNNQIKITNKYLSQGLNIVTNIILTKDLCTKIINKEFDVLDFINKYKCWVNFIPYIIYDEELSAKRSDIFKSLNIINNSYHSIDNISYIEKYINNLDLPQEKLLYIYKNNKFEFCSSKLNNCGHSINFKRYSKNNTCFICDLKKIFRSKY